jgi:Cellulase (glycosyl hydrolase family 5)/Ricin-type beta-trefoil lectin domain-like
MKEKMERNQQSRRSFLRTNAAVSSGVNRVSSTEPLSALVAERTQNQRAARARFVGRPRAYFTLIGIFAITLATFLIMQPFHARSAHAAGSVGFHVSGRSLLDVNGNNFIVRGISHGYTWYLSQNASFPNIKAAGANTIRVVLSGGNNGGTATSLASVQTAINLCKSNKLVCVLEDHDTTGYTGQGTGSLAQAVSYWESLQSILTGQENWVIINIGNESWGNTNMNGWIGATENAIVSMRNAGFRHTLMVDGPGWGQDPNDIMLNNASSIESTDPMHNTIFSVHMYGVYASASTVDSYISSFYNTGMPFLVGEFGSTQPGASSSDDADEIMADTQSRGIGYMAWSWSGNGGTAQYLDMVTNFNPSQRTSWGNRVITGANGLQQTSHECSCYGSGGGGGGGSNFTPIAGAHYKLVNHNSGQVLDIANKSTVNGGLANQWTDSGTSNQQWSFVASNGGYKIVNLNSGLLLDDPGGSTSTGTQLDQWNDTNGSNQWWNIVSAGGGYYYLVNQSSGLSADVSGASTTAGAAVIQWTGGGGNNQQWSFVAV